MMSLFATKWVSLNKKTMVKTYYHHNVFLFGSFGRTATRVQLNISNSSTNAGQPLALPRLWPATATHTQQITITWNENQKEAKVNNRDYEILETSCLNNKAMKIVWSYNSGQMLICWCAALFHTCRWVNVWMCECVCLQLAQVWDHVANNPVSGCSENWKPKHWHMYMWPVAGAI